MHHGHLSKLQVGGEMVRRIAWLGISRFWLHRQTDGLKLQHCSHNFVTDPYILIFIPVP